MNNEYYLNEFALLFCSFFFDFVKPTSHKAYYQECDILHQDQNPFLISSQVDSNLDIYT